MRLVKSLVVACLMLSVSGCSKHIERPSAGPPRLVAPSQLTPQERRFGVAPTRNSQVSYQPDVIIVENGSEAIRAISGNGLTWTVDAKAVAQHDIRPGKVVFLTSRAVGRVLALERSGDSVALTLGPVELGDVIRDCDIQLEAPIDFSQALVYTLDAMPGAAEPVAPLAWSQRADRFRLVADGGDDGTRITGPIAALGNLGAQIHGEKHGTGLNGDVQMHLQSPRIEFKLVMSGAQVKEAVLKVHGGVGVSIGFEAVNRDGSKHNLNEQVQVPADISIPIGGPLPLTITVRQQFKVQTAFGAPGVLKARADYTYSGALGVAYHDPFFLTPDAPSGFSGRESLLNSVQGVSLNAGALSLTHQLKVIGGFGAFNFVVGPYTFLNTNANVTHHGATDTLARCTFAGFNMRAGVGVGYVIPQPVTKAINFFLGALNLKPIRGEGGKEGPSKFLLKNDDVWPASAVCTPDTNSTKKGPAVVA